MDAKRFDHWTVAVTKRPTRRATLRLLAGGLLGGLLAQRGVAPTRAAQRPDRDGDGLYDDDEPKYGTNPDVYDTDGDGASDGLEIYNRDQGLGGHDDPLVNENAAPPPPPALVCGENQMDCGGFCVNHVTDSYNCGYCGRVCPFGTVCDRASCRAPACVANGESCYTDFNCCAGRCAKRGEFAKGICERVWS